MIYRCHVVVLVTALTCSSLQTDCFYLNAFRHISMVQTRKTNKDAHPGLVDQPPARKSRQQIADERKEAEQKKKGKQKVVSDVMEMEDAIRTKEAQERAEARQPPGPGVSKVKRPPPSTQSVTTDRARGKHTP
jgi:hypothetical protein